MRPWIIISLLTLVVASIGVAAYKPVSNAWRKRSLNNWREVEVEQGTIVSVVNSTGEVKPVLSVSVGSVVSGPIVKLSVDFNDEVTKDQVLAVIDKRPFQAFVDRDKATLLSRQADVLRAKALLEQAKNDEKRAMRLRAKNKDYISQSEMDQLKFNRQSLEAQVQLSEASVEQARASLRNSEANLSYCEIKAPVSGIVIDRKIEPGQSLAAAFQTPELFIVSPDMRSAMHVFAAVDEADIGMIAQALKDVRPVEFTVDGYPEELFKGTIKQIRMSSAQTQNVVTYPVVVEAPNPEMKLMPGMTASITFEVDKKEDVIKIPNAALRFYPDQRFVHKDDRKVLTGEGLNQEEDEEDPPESMLSAGERTRARAKRNKRHVWVAEENLLRAVEVVIGISDNKFSQLISGDLKPGQKLVTGIKPKTGGPWSW